MIQAFVEAWSAISTFLVGLFPDLIALFWSGTELTFIGVMAVITAGIAMILLIFNLIRSFFVMRG